MAVEPQSSEDVQRGLEAIPQRLFLAPSGFEAILELLDVKA